jgi:hypothetical protein
VAQNQRLCKLVARKRPRDSAQLAKLMIDIASGTLSDTTRLAKEVPAGNS